MQKGRLNLPMLFKHAVLLLMAERFGTNETWLRTGVGDMTAGRSREQEMAALVKSLMADSPESFRSAIVTTLLRFDPNRPEWEVLERIYDKIANAKNTAESAIPKKKESTLTPRKPARKEKSTLPTPLQSS